MFVEERLLDSVSYGTVYGESFSTDIKVMRNKSESRNMEWSESRGQYTLVFNALLEEDRSKVMRVFRACRGMGIGFRLKNWVEYQAFDEELGIMEDTTQTFQLKKTSVAGQYKTIKRIRKPVEGTVKVFVNGLQTAAIVDYTTGIIEVSAMVGSKITWSGEYDIPVRFDNDDIQWSVDSKTGQRFIMGTDVDLVEIET